MFRYTYVAVYHKLSYLYDLCSILGQSRLFTGANLYDIVIGWPQLEHIGNIEYYTMSIKKFSEHRTDLPSSAASDKISRWVNPMT
jgi:hypothetical protein